MNVVILSCGSGIPEVVSEYGHSSEWIPKTINNTNINYSINRVYEYDSLDISQGDAFIITGSKFSVNDNIPWIPDLINFTKKIVESGKSLLGICFGHQIIASALGGLVEKNKLGWELGSYSISLTEDGKKSFIFSNFYNGDIVYESHQDVVTKLPNNTIELAFTEKANQSFIYNDNIIGVQFHPEFSFNVTRKLMDIRINKGIKVDSDNLKRSTNGKNILVNYCDFLLRRNNEKSNF